MATVNNCNLPEELYYDIEKQVWGRLEADGTITVGMTAPGAAQAGQLLHLKPKKPGTQVARQKSIGTAESGKWVGAVASPVSGEVIEANEALGSDAAMVNRDPYGTGWVVKIRPSDWETEKGSLVTGAAAIEAYKAKMTQDNISCG